MSDMVFGDDGFDVEIGGGAVESAAELHSGNRCSKEGYYHVECLGIENKAEEGKLRHFVLDYKILAGSADMKGTNPLKDQVGKSVRQTIYLEGWQDKAAGVKKPLEERAWKGIRSFAYGFGLITEGQLSEARPRINFAAIENRQAVVKVGQDDDYTGDDGVTRAGGFKVQWSNDVWPVTSEKVRGVPKDLDHLAMLGVSGGGPLDI